MKGVYYMNKNFLKEINQYDYSDLKLIYETQKDLYSKEELEIIKYHIQELEEKGQTKPQKQFPKKIKCDKCDQYNLFENEVCDYCKCKLNKRKYFNDNYIYDPDEENNNNINTEISNKSYAFQYVFSFLIPLIGFILGAILLSKDNDDERSVGKICIVLGVVSIIIDSIIMIFIWK